MNKKWQKLENIIKKMESVLIAFSGGVDSTLLAKVSHDLLGNKAIAVTGLSDIYPGSELKKAKEIAKIIGIRHIIIKTEELKNKKFIKNDLKRCYYCKKGLFLALKKIAKKNKITHIIEGSNSDDLSDYRPGINAAKELKIDQPFIKAKITKLDIRKRAKSIGLSNWNKPASPCLSSRLPYNEKITLKKLRMIEKAEAFLKSNNFCNIRVRHHKNIARIEIDKDDFNKIIGLSDKIVKKFKKIGYVYITLDIQGFRSGNLNEFLKKG